MSYSQLAYFHLATVVPAFLIGSCIFLTKKGTATHKWLGKIYMALMLITAAITLFMAAVVGPTLFGHFGYLHLFSLTVFVGVPLALYGARTGNLWLHVGSMTGLYVGGLLIAGGFAFLPGRLLHSWIFS